ncbi:MAG: hypothetical protein WD845_02640 [Pirellulales bacterium]
MRCFLTFSAVVIAGLAAAGCATGIQGLAVLSSMHHGGGGQPTFSEFAANEANYSPAATDGLLAESPAGPPEAVEQEPTEPADGFASVSDSGVRWTNAGSVGATPETLVPPAEAATSESITPEHVPFAAATGIDSGPGPEGELGEMQSPAAPPLTGEVPIYLADADRPGGATVDGRTPQNDASAATEGTAKQHSDVFAQAPLIDDATGYPVALGQDEIPAGEAIATPRPDVSEAFAPHTDEAAIDRFTRRLVDVPLDIRPTEGIMPGDPAATKFAESATMDPRELHQVPGIVCACTPWTICFRPLYFEEVALERYGDKARFIQPAVSGVRFFSHVALLPYKMRVRPPRSCVCSNGFSRVGDCPPPGYGECVWRWDAAAIEIAAVTGFVFILP